MPSKIAQELADSVVCLTEYQSGDTETTVTDEGQYASIFGYGFAWASYKRDSEDTLRYVWQHEGEVKKQLAELIDKGIEARLAEVVAQLDQKRGYLHKQADEIMEGSMMEAGVYMYELFSAGIESLVEIARGER